MPWGHQQPQQQQQTNKSENKSDTICASGLNFKTFQIYLQKKIVKFIVNKKIYIYL